MITPRKKDFASLNPDINELTEFWNSHKDLYQQRLEEIQESNINGKGEIKENMLSEKAFNFLFQPNIYLEYKNNRGCTYYLFICNALNQKGVRLIASVSNLEKKRYDQTIPYCSLQLFKHI